MFFATFLCGLIGPKTVLADGWDDFSNNLATDLAPLLSLFGEQVTKQYLSESINVVDYFIFAMAPIGILTALTAAIRVCGTPSLRALIGRAQEGGGNAEAELCSSTSRDVCELYNNGGIARVFGSPKILEIVYDPNVNEGPGLNTFQDYVNTPNGEKEWKEKGDHDIEKVGLITHGPNLSLNIGIKSQPQPLFWAAAFIGLLLQSGVMAFAAIVTYYLKWEKNGSAPESYACPLALTGTILVCGGVFICAFLVGESTHEQVFGRQPIRRGDRPSNEGDQPSNQSDQTIKPDPRPSILYWVQPGPQKHGDQSFDSFCYSDCDNPLNEYIISRKDTSKQLTDSLKVAVWAAVGITISGFVLQFVGLRGIHSAVSLAQIGSIMVMSAIRAGLRMKRFKSKDDLFHDCKNHVIGNELDWLAMKIGERGLQNEQKTELLSQECNVASSSESHTQSGGGTNAEFYFWSSFGIGATKNEIVEKFLDTPAGSTGARKLLTYRSRLAELTDIAKAETKAEVCARHFEDEQVEVRENAKRLTLAIESVADMILSKSSKVQKVWQDALSLHWVVNCDVAYQKGNLSETINSDTLGLCLKRNGLGNGWKLERPLDIEGILGLWVWSLKSNPIVPPSVQGGQTAAPARTEIHSYRIISTSPEIAEIEMENWYGSEAMNLKKMALTITPDFPNQTWEQKINQHAVKVFEKSTDQVPKGSQVARLFGWNALEGSQVACPFVWNALEPPQDKTLTIWSVLTEGSLLSLCTQDVFGSFIKSAFNMIDGIEDIKNIGGMMIQQHHDNLYSENGLLSSLIKLFMEHQLGTREEALICILPSIISSTMRSSTSRALTVARRGAIRYRKLKKWEEAENVLKWTWHLYSSQPSNSSTTQPNMNMEETAIALGELYRWAMREDKRGNFCRDGMAWLQKNCHESCPETTKRYQDIEKWYLSKGTMHSSMLNGETRKDILSEIKGGRCQALVFLTSFWGTSKHSGPTKSMGEALHLAASKGWTEVVLALLELGAKPDSDKGELALMEAVKGGYSGTVEELLHAGTNQDCMNEQSRTPLSYASESGSVEMVKLLLGTGKANPKLKDKANRTPLWYAAANGNWEVIEILLRIDEIRLNSDRMVVPEGANTWFSWDPEERNYRQPKQAAFVQTSGESLDVQDIAIWLKGFDYSCQARFDIMVNALRPSSHGFNVELETNIKTRSTLFSGVASWLTINNPATRDFQTGVFDMRTDPEQPENWSSIKFNRPFDSPPKVVVWLKGFEIGKGEIVGMSVSTRNVTNSHFEIGFNAPPRAKLSRGIATWIAYPMRSKDVFSGSGDFTPNTEPITIPVGQKGAGPHNANFQVWSGFKSFCVSGTTNYRLRIETATSSDGNNEFQINLDTWGGSTFESVSCSYLVIFNKS